MIKIKFGRKKVDGIITVKAPTFFEAGRQIGEVLKKQTVEAAKLAKVDKLIKKFPDWMEKGKTLSKKVTPNAYQIALGIGEGAGLSEDEVFALWYEELTYADTKDKSKLKDTGCTDIIVKSGDNVIIGHTNDFTPGDNSRLFKMEIKNQPALWMVFSMGCPSIGLNANGMVFSGNQVDANDTRSGIPRMMLYMEGALSDSIEEAKKLFLHKDRASSFNNIVADSKGFIKTLEASATAQKEITHDNDSVEAHSNHFIWLKNKEGREDKSYNDSVKRLERAYEEGEKAGNDMTLEDMKNILSSHGEGGLCRHSKDKNGTATVFSVIFLPKQRKFYFSNGYPCQGNYKEIGY
jgi:hypothetical protein